MFIENCLVLLTKQQNPPHVFLSDAVTCPPPPTAAWMTDMGAGGGGAEGLVLFPGEPGFRLLDSGGLRLCMLAKNVFFRGTVHFSRAIGTYSIAVKRTLSFDLFKKNLDIKHD